MQAINSPKPTLKSLNSTRSPITLNIMKFVYLFLLVTQSFALQYTLPSNFGGQTDFSNKGWKTMIEELSPEVGVGQPPTIEVNIAEEPTCGDLYSKCSTSYFGKDLTLTKPDSAQLWIKWHQDTPPFACYNPYGCIVTSDSSVADLTSQSKGWKVKASINANSGANNNKSTTSALLSYRYSEVPISPKTMTSTKTLTSSCFGNHMCYLHTGTLMMTVSGKCDSKPVIVCDRRYFPCEEFNHRDPDMCMQWDLFTLRHCPRSDRKANIESCSLTVAVIGENGLPMSFQVFEQKPLSDKRSIAKRDDNELDSTFDEHPDGSSGVWMPWSP